MAESTTTTALAVYLFTDKKSLKRFRLPQASLAPSESRVLMRGQPMLNASQSGSMSTESGSEPNFRGYFVP